MTSMSASEPPPRVSGATRAFGFGGGLRIPVGRKNSDFAIDLGAKYFDGGEAEYLTKGDIVDNPDGTITLTNPNAVAALTAAGCAMGPRRPVAPTGRGGRPGPVPGDHGRRRRRLHGEEHRPQGCPHRPHLS